MKDLKFKLINLFKEGYCTPQISRIAKNIDEPTTTIHYNIKKLEEKGIIKTYKGVFDYKKIGEGFCAYVLISLSFDEYSSPERIAKDFAEYKEVESVDILTGEWDLIVKVRTKDQEEYYNFVKTLGEKTGLQKTMTMVSLKQIKTEFVLL
jgi:DNA-binding Lrp family transcriptional regulator